MLNLGVYTQAYGISLIHLYHIFIYALLFIFIYVFFYAYNMYIDIYIYLGQIYELCMYIYMVDLNI